MIAFLSYFAVPAAVFLLLVKLNHKYEWLVKRPHDDENYFFGKNKRLWMPFFWMLTFLFFTLWWVMIPLGIVSVGISILINKITSGKGIIPIRSRSNV